MKELNILNLIRLDEEIFEEGLCQKIESNPIYKKATYLVDTRLRTLTNDTECLNEIETAIIDMTFLDRDVSFSEGFKMGVRFMISSMND